MIFSAESMCHGFFHPIPDGTFVCLALAKMILTVERPSHPSFFQLPVVGPETACSAMMTAFGCILAYFPSLLTESS